MTAQVRRFDTGATRDLDEEKLDFDGFLSPLVLERYAEYMHKNRHLRDGTLRASDNWKKGIPLTVYMKSLWRHFKDMWREHHGIPTKEGMEDNICGILFNAMGYLHEHLQSGQTRWVLTTDPETTERMGELLADGSFVATVDLEDDEDLGLKAGEAFREPPPNCDGNSG